MHPILEKLKAYLASATEDQLKADWEELKQYNVSGPEMLDVLEAASQRLQFDFELKSIVKSALREYISSSGANELIKRLHEGDEPVTQD